MLAPARASTGAVVLSVILSLVILLVWIAEVATLADLGHSDAAGNAMAEGFAAIEIILLWALLSALVIVAALQGTMPWPAIAAAIILIPASGYAAAVALDLLSDRTMRPFLWPIVTPALVPPIVVAFCFWTLVPSLRTAIPAVAASAIAWGAILVLCIGLWPMVQVRDRALEHAADVRQQWAEDFARVPPNAPLWQWTRFLDTPDGTRQEDVLDRIRKLDHRQADAEIMLERGDFPLLYLGSFDLDPTTSICDKARDMLRRRVQPLVAKSPGSRPYSDVGMEVAGVLSAMKWLVGYGCPCDAESQAWESMAKAYRDPNFDVYELAELREPRQLGRLLREYPARFSMLTPQAHLRAWLSFADKDDLREQALAGARKLDHRTADAVAMLGEDEFAAGTVLKYMPVLDLEATEPLCRASLQVLYGDLTHVYRPTPNDPRPYSELLERLGGYEPLTALLWLASHGCDADAALSDAEDLVGTYQASPDRAVMLANLARLRHR
jgi:hypothetical protein